MKEKSVPHSHNWNVTPAEAIAIQKQLRDQVQVQPLGKKICFIAGADVSLNLFSKTIYAGIIVLSYPDLEIIDHALVKSETSFPYIPGLLSFREAPALLECWKKLKTKPDLVVVDGVGIAHPRRIGIASHFGILANIPTIGCSKNILTGEYEEPAIEAGSSSPIYARTPASSTTVDEPQEIIGTAIRTKNKVKPVFVSPGHLISAEESAALILSCVRKHRLPEPTRQAHLLVNKFRTGEIF